MLFQKIIKGMFYNWLGAVVGGIYGVGSVLFWSYVTLDMLNKVAPFIFPIRSGAPMAEVLMILTTPGILAPGFIFWVASVLNFWSLFVYLLSIVINLAIWIAVGISLQNKLTFYRNKKRGISNPNSPL